MGYKDAHRRVRQERGPATDRFCTAGRCDLAAEEWALSLERAAGQLMWEGQLAYSDNPYHYDPLCKRCHRLGDGNRYA